MIQCFCDFVPLDGSSPNLSVGIVPEFKVICMQWGGMHALRPMSKAGHISGCLNVYSSDVPHVLCPDGASLDDLFNWRNT